MGGGGRLGGVHDRLHIYPLCGIFYFPWHRHQIEGTNGFYCLIRKTGRFTISNVITFATLSENDCLNISMYGTELQSTSSKPNQPCEESNMIPAASRYMYTVVLQ